ncbi:XVIPCD domain-containing protein [Luteibacter sp. CQ10]|uniref:XVIPCD domain-containing protein n=1 Tax=Luteibacter sp. CQ10 TaxID=2805821 RepID=UPI0034A3BA82
MLDAANDPITGFQAQAYVREDVQPQQVIVAFRGTEFDRQPVRDGGVDAGMVLTGLNLQTPDALAFTRRVMNEANKAAENEGRKPPEITVTGHSLGGTLAEISAYEFGLKGETFNAYGAAGLRQGIPEGGTQVIDHVRAGDLVSAASAHFGEVRVYAAQQDIDTLTKAGYRDDSGLLSLRNPIKATDFSAHAIDNFIPDSKLLGQSILSEESQARYRAHEGMVDRYRDDVMDIRKGISAPWEIPHAIGELKDFVEREALEKVGEGLQAIEHGVEDVVHKVEEGFEHLKEGVQHVREEIGEGIHAIEEKASSAWHTLTHPSDWFDHGKVDANLTDTDHPDRRLFEQAINAVHRLDAQHHRVPDQNSQRFAASLTVAARKEGLQRIDHVVLSQDGEQAYAIQGDIESPLKKVAMTDTSRAIATSVEASSGEWRETANREQQRATSNSIEQRQRATHPFDWPSM